MNGVGFYGHNLVPITNFAALETGDGIRYLQDLFHNTMHQPKLYGDGQGISRAFQTLDDLQNRIQHINIVQASMARSIIHYMNVDVLPLMYTDDRFFSTTWKEVERTLPILAPALGTSRVSRMRVHQSMSRMKDYAQGAFMESRYLESPEGRSDFIMHIAAFTQSERDHHALMAFYRLLQPDTMRLFNYGMNDNPSYNDYISMVKTQRDLFGICNKEPVGTNRIILEAASKMLRYDNVVPTIAIAPIQKIKLLMSTGNPQYYNYANAGADGVRNMNAKYDEIMKLNGISVREAPTAKTYLGYKDDYIDCEHHEEVVGEFLACVQHDEMSSAYSAIYAGYDDSIDTYKSVSFGDLLTHSQTFKFCRAGDRIDVFIPGDEEEVITAPVDGYYLDEAKIRDVARDEINMRSVRVRPHPFMIYGSKRVIDIGQLQSNAFVRCGLRQFYDTMRFNIVGDYADIVNIIWAACPTVHARIPNANLILNESPQQFENFFTAVCYAIIEHGNTNGQFNNAGGGFNNVQRGRLNVFLRPYILYARLMCPVDPSNDDGEMHAWHIDPKYYAPYNVYGVNTGNVVNTFDFSIREWEKSQTVEHLIFRFKHYYMNDMVLCKGGRELGLTLRSSSTIKIGNDVGNFSHKIEWRSSSACHLVNPRLCCVIPNVAYDGIIGGVNMKLINADAADRLKQNDFRFDNIDFPSAYVLVIPYGSFDKDRELLHLFGEHRWSNGQAEDYPGARYYCKLYGWIVASGDDDEESEHAYPLPRVLFRSSIQYLSATGTKRHVHGRTHHGPYEGVGCQSVRKYGTSVVQQMA